LVLQMFMSVDGYIESAGGVGAAFALRPREFRHEQGFWQAAEHGPASRAAGIAYAGTMNRLPRTVVSTTMRGDPGWNATLDPATWPAPSSG
jgi:hypothetical protein